MLGDPTPGDRSQRQAHRRVSGQAPTVGSGPSRCLLRLPAWRPQAHDEWLPLCAGCPSGLSPRVVHRRSFKAGELSFNRLTNAVRAPRRAPDPLQGLLAALGHARARLPPRHPAQDDRCHDQAEHGPGPEHRNGFQVPPGLAQLDADRAIGQQGRPHAQAKPVHRERLGDPMQPFRQGGDRVEDPGDRDQAHDRKRNVARAAGAGDQRSEHGADELGRHESQEQHPGHGEPGTDAADAARRR
jgi:hypothetical protein